MCAIRDELRPVLERAREADVLILGTPVYYSYPTGVMRSFMERLMFPVGTYGQQYFLEHGMRVAEDFEAGADFPTLYAAQKICGDLLEYWKYTDANGMQRPTNMASWNGRTVLIDDDVPVG